MKATEAIGSKRPRRGAARAPVREETTPEEEEDEIEDDDSVEMVEPPAKRTKAEAGPSRKGKERETAGSSGKEALEQALRMMERGADQVKAGAGLLRTLLLGEPSVV